MKKPNKRLTTVSFLYGSISRPPQPSLGNNARVMKPPRATIMSREFKVRIAVSTTGTQTSETICLSLYKPLQYSRIVAGTPTATTTIPAILSDAAAIYREFRVKKILIQYSNVIGTSTAYPPLYSFMDPETTPMGVSAGGQPVTYVNEYQNAVQVDAHVSTSWGYWVPHPTSLANGVDNVMNKGWISTDQIGTALSPINDVGVIGLTYGDTVVSAPLTTTAGVIDVVYLIEFKLPD